MKSSRGIISISDLSEAEIQSILARAEELKKEAPKDLLQGQILATCFFEASTRTRLSFESAMHRLGGDVIGFSDSQNISSKKGESLADTIRVISTYADAIVLRHPLEGAARLAQEMCSKPIINAGDGANQHPTQTLVDLFTIKECQGKLHHLHIAIAGDLKYGRTVHSLAQACAHFDARFYFISPEQLTAPDHILHELRKKGVKFSFHRTIEEVIPKIDILYMTRIQKERFQEGEYSRIRQQFILSATMLKEAKPSMKILHPLPRVQEIDQEIDHQPHAHYFHQAANGIAVRQSILTHLLWRN